MRSRFGGWKYIRARGCPILEKDGGSIREWIGTLEDVTVQSAAAAEVQLFNAEANAERRRLEEVFQHAPSFIAVFRGPDHVFERINDRYSKLIGERNVVGLAIREALPEVAGQGYFELLDKVYQTGITHSEINANVILNHPGGPVGKTVEFVYQPMVDSHGTVTGVIVQGIDLTERREAEQGLVRATSEKDRLQRMYETALSHTADFVYLFDTTGRFTYINKALLDLWGKTFSESVGKNFIELDYPPELAAKLQRQIEEVVRSASPVRDETPYTSAEGTEAYEYIFMPVFGPDGTVEAVAGSTREISDRKRSEEALRASEERYRALVIASSDVVYRMSGDWTELYPLNGRGLIASNDEPNRNWMERNIPPSEHSRIREAIANAVAGKSMFELEHQVFGEDGSIGWTLSRAVPICNDTGEITEWFGTASDVTRRKEAESALNDIRSRMEAALSAGAIGTWSWDVQADAFYGDASLVRIFGVDTEHVSGGKIANIMETIHPEDRERVSSLIEMALASGDSYEADYRVAQPDETYKWVTARGKIERNQMGGPVRFPGVVIDITDRKRAEKNLARVTAESDQRRRIYETILSNTPDFAYVIGLDHRFIYCNDPLLRMWGRTWNEAVGKTFLEIGYEPWHAEMHEQEVDTVKATRKPVRGEVPFNGTLGKRIYDYIFVPVFDSNGEVEAVAGTTRDVTERKAVEESILEADKKKDDFLALLAHELRNPLAPIRNGLEVLRLAEGDEEAMKSAREMMDRQLSHMVRLIDDLLDISRITTNKLELRRKRITLREVVNSGIEGAGHLVTNSGHELTVILPSEEIILNADLTRLAQVLSNLLANSAKYTPRGGKIEVSARRIGSEVQLSVSDTGLGIPEAELPRIFDMFRQVDRNVERSTGGLGIGLALVKGLVEMHSGSVAVESAEGKGSTFTVSLPVTEAELSMAESTKSKFPTKRAKCRVLVVDDNRDGTRTMAMMLRLLGNDVTTAHDGPEAVTLAERFRPNLILMDIGLPSISGLDATRLIKAEVWGKDIKIVALTGWGQDSDREQSHAAGCFGHLVKPVELSDLEKVLEEVCPINP